MPTWKVINVKRHNKLAPKWMDMSSQRPFQKVSVSGVSTLRERRQFMYAKNVFQEVNNVDNNRTGRRNMSHSEKDRWMHLYCRN
ncbi:hypothetical protein QCA50_011587 [Cerrena zonata]|uniref:Uncharacterized protein n=1 Tax=Cerrena zonata TaxID=2478898 RepID=A0AAW0G4J8_9APHY